MTTLIEGEAVKADETGFAADMAELEQQLRAEVDAAPLGKADEGVTDEEERAVLRYFRVRSIKAALLQRLQDQYKAMIADAEREVDRLDYLYRELAERVTRAKLTGKVKTWKTPFGSGSFRTLPAKLEIVNEDALKEAIVAGDVPDTVQRVKIEISRTALNEYVEANPGVLPPGCEMKPAVEKFYIK